MERLINADKLRDEILHDPEYDNNTINHFLDIVDEQPEIDAEPVRHGKIIEPLEAEWYAEWGKCSICGSVNRSDAKYCQWCGAKMDLEDKNG